MNVAEIWPEVKEFYEKHYKLKFPSMPAPHKVRFLYEEMKKMKETMRDHQEAIRDGLVPYVGAKKIH